jgi:hypothetical protein
MPKTRSTTLVALALGTALAAPSAFAQTDRGGPVELSVPSVDGAEVTLDVTVPRAGFAVLSEAGDLGAPIRGGMIDWAEVEEGENEDVTFTGDNPFDMGRNYVVTLHEDTDGDGSFDPAVDVSFDIVEGTEDQTFAAPMSPEG